MSEPVEKTPIGVTDDSKNDTEVEHGGRRHNLDRDAKFSDYKENAIDAENVELNMTVLEAVRAYPMASTWAFIMSCTIVGTLRLPIVRIESYASSRSWSLTASS